MTKQLILVLGGARSGKSTFAERLARRRGGRVLYVATAEAMDEDMERRIMAHRQQRPEEWQTLEEPLELTSALPPVLGGYDTCLLDCLTLWASNLLLSMEGNPNAEQEIQAAAGSLLDVYEQSSATWIMVSNEVGLGVVPPSRLGAVYRDALGRVNQAVAARADRVYFMVAGLALEMKSLGALSYTSLELYEE
jgi:adenosyl cobinamide kinase/adenosyl cobinamide phosphate guanylyltransferase